MYFFIPWPFAIYTLGATIGQCISSCLKTITRSSTNLSGHKWDKLRFERPQKTIIR